MDWMFVSSQNSYVEALTLSVMVLEGGVFGRQLGLDEAMRVQSTMWSKPLKAEKETPELLLCHVKIQREGSLLQAREKGLHKN